MEVSKCVHNPLFQRNFWNKKNRIMHSFLSIFIDWLILQGDYLWHSFVCNKLVNHLVPLASKCSVEHLDLNLKWHLPSRTFHGTEKEFGIWTWEPEKAEMSSCSMYLSTCLHKGLLAEPSWLIPIYSIILNWFRDSEVTLLQSDHLKTQMYKPKTYHRNNKYAR